MSKNQLIIDALNTLAQLAYDDAVKHKLYDDLDNMNSIDQRRWSAMRIALECGQLYEAAGNVSEYQKELADVVLMSASTAGRYGIDIGKCVQDKRQKNISRPIKHKGEKLNG